MACLPLQRTTKAEKIGVIGICGWGGIALNAAAADSRIKATVASTMYDMTRVGGKGNYIPFDKLEVFFRENLKSHSLRK